MAGKGGGAWKVAYADFVTAMMAFFLVMWLVTQDKKAKEAVARYFSDPVGFYQIGTNKRPGEAGAMFDSENRGKVPGKTYTQSGHGRGSHTDRGQGEAETRAVGEWLKANPETMDYWKAQARRQKELAEQNEYVREKVISVNEAARTQLSKQIEREFIDKLPPDLDPMVKDLVLSGLRDVDWRGVAEQAMEF